MTIVNGQSTKVLLADDDSQMQLAITACLERRGYSVTVVGDGAAALKALEEEQFELVITDQRMPEMTGQELLAELQKRDMNVPVVMITAHGTITQAVEAMQAGAADFITKPFGLEDLVRVVERVLSPEAESFRKQGKKGAKGRPIITTDPMMIRILEVAEAVARSDATVLIQGESGTGKELIARFVHASSARSNNPFVAVNCAALPENLLESELFGHEKGAFTGAQARKIGKFELAHGGTILLDEISEMDLLLQAKLLRVLQEREVDRVGGQSPVAVDVRVLATTNRNLEEMVRSGKFREDLFYRLNVIPLTLPPLRERPSDVKLLVEHYMRHYLGDKAPALSAEVLAQLQGYRWPGNIRELQNAVERAAILARGNSLKGSDFMLGMHGSALAPAVPSKVEGKVEASSALESRVETIVDENSDGVETPASSEGTGGGGAEDDLRIRSGVTVQEMERRLIVETLKATSDNRTKAAELLGISIRTLRNKLNEYRMSGGEAE
jgi:two-component system response regulator FlrC